MLVRERAKQRGPRKPVERTPDKKRLNKVTKSVKAVKSIKKKIEPTGLNEFSPFRKAAPNTMALDKSYERAGSVSPLKYRPRVDMTGIASPGGKSDSYPDYVKHPLTGMPRNRSNSKKSILKSSRSQQFFEFTSPHRHHHMAQTVNNAQTQLKN